MQFRHDINGLRAIAVLAVVIFHFNPHWLVGGFAGVDVFFVISGFLMTSIIFTGIQKNTFNLFEFYNARANRIIPVLTAVFMALIFFGWFYLLPTDYQVLGKQIEKSSIFTSNLLFSQGYGYFDSSEHTKWLLHTWSLSVEWQFYIVFPIIIFTLSRYIDISQLKRIVMVLCLISFIYCIYATNKDSKVAYFLLSSRAWEMLFGGLAFLYPWTFKTKSSQYIIHCLGLIIIVASYFLVSKNIPWPGYMAFFPVLGAYMVLVSHCQTSIITNNLIFNLIGKWSYSIYVWHWPLVVLGFYFSFTKWWIYGIPLSILFGFLSYQLIEKIKFRKYSSWKQIYKVTPFYFVLLSLICGYVIKETEGVKHHYSKQVLDLLAESKNHFPYLCKTGLTNGEIDICRIGASHDIGAIVVGDSHAKALTSAVIESLGNKKSILSITTAGCPYILNANFDNNFCKSVNDKKQQFLQNSQGVPIIVINRYLQRLEGENNDERVENDANVPIYFSNIKASKNEIYAEFQKNLQLSICKLTPKSPVYLMTAVPEFPFHVPKMMGKQWLLDHQVKENSMPIQEYDQRAQRLNQILYQVAQNCGAHIIDSRQVLCQNNQCMSQLNHCPIYKDGDHLSEYGNKLFVPKFKNIFKNERVLPE